MWLKAICLKYVAFGFLVLFIAATGIGCSIHESTAHKEANNIGSQQATDDIDPATGNPKIIKAHSPDGAVMIGDTNFLANYLKNGGDPNLKKEGSPLLALCWVGSGCGYKCAAMLLESGAKADATTSYGDTALMEAAMWADTEGMRLLLRYGANPNAKNQGGETPLHRLASSSSTLEAVKVLVEAKANINAKTKEGETVLDHLKSEPKVVEYLRQIGAR